MLRVLRVLTGKVYHLEAERLERVTLEAAPGWIWLIGNPMGRGSGSYSHKPVEPVDSVDSVDSVDQFCQPTPLYLLLFFPWK